VKNKSRRRRMEWKRRKSARNQRDAFYTPFPLRQRI
jgi:hypothetical protein